MKRLGLAAVVLIVAVAALLWQRDEGVPSQRTPALTSAASGAQANDHGLQAAPSVRERRGATDADRQSSESDEQSVQEGRRAGLWMLDDPTLPLLVADVLVATRFPPDARALRGDPQTLVNNRRYDTAMPLASEEGEPLGASVLFTGDRYRLLGDDVLTARIEVRRDDAPIDARVLRVLAHPEGAVSAGVQLPPVTTEGTGIFTFTFTPGRALPPTEAAARVVLDAEIALADGASGHATLVLEYQPEAAVPARFTGAIREELVDGSPHFQVEVDVDSAGSYRFDGNVLDAAGSPLAALLSRTELSPGRHWITLRLFGRIVHEARAPSPFSLVDVRGYRFVPDADPDREHMHAWPGPWHSRTYQLEELASEEHWDERKQARVDRLLEQAKSGGKAALAVRLDGSVNP